MNIREKIEGIFYNVGLDISDSNEWIDQMDSLSFVTVIVELEQEFDVEFPDEYLNINLINSIEELEEVVKKLLLEKESSNN